MSTLNKLKLLLILTIIIGLDNKNIFKNLFISIKMCIFVI